MTTQLAQSLIIEGKPQPKGRPRFSKSGHAYTPTATRQWEGYLRDLYALHFREPLEGNLEVDLTFYTTSRADLDNLAKAVLDAGNGIIFKDDIQVKKLHIEKINSKEEYTILVVCQISA